MPKLNGGCPSSNKQSALQLPLAELIRKDEIEHQRPIGKKDQPFYTKTWKDHFRYQRLAFKDKDLERPHLQRHSPQRHDKDLKDKPTVFLMLVEVDWFCKGA